MDEDEDKEEMEPPEPRRHDDVGNTKHSDLNLPAECGLFKLNEDEDEEEMDPPEP